jgi:hypothetical protein
LQRKKRTPKPTKQQTEQQQSQPQPQPQHQPGDENNSNLNLDGDDDHKPMLDQLNHHELLASDFEEFPLNSRIITLKNQIIIITSQSISITPKPGADQITLDSKELGGEFLIAALEDCEVEVQGLLQTLTLKHLKRCSVSVGVVMHSIFMDSCSECTFQLASQQIRIHNTNHSIFYVLCKSNPIIEDCSSLKFGIYHFQYDHLDDDLHVCIYVLNYTTFK